MEVGDMKALVRRLYEELWGDGDLSIIDHCIARDYVNHQRVVDPHLSPSVSAVEICGRDMFKTLVGAWRAGFPDVRTTVEDQIAEGDKVATRWISRGTQTGPWMRVAASGKPMLVEGISIDRIADGKVVETWTNWDLLGLMQQIGAVRSPL
ncbi:ester cyclase [bacterium]|nr:ester cyclase [bacterium]